MAISKLCSSYKTKIPGLVFQRAKIGAGSKLERDFDRYANTIRNYVVDGLEKNKGVYPNGRRVGYHKIDSKEFFKVFMPNNKSKFPDVLLEVSPETMVIDTKKIKFFVDKFNIIKNIFN